MFNGKGKVNGKFFFMFFLYVNFDNLFKYFIFNYNCFLKNDSVNFVIIMFVDKEMCEKFKFFEM